MADPLDLHARFDKLEAQHDLIFRALHILGKGIPEMSAITDKLKTMAADQKAKIAELSGLSDDTNSALTDLVPAFQANSDALDDLVASHKQAQTVATGTDAGTPADTSATIIPGLPGSATNPAPTPAAGGTTILADGTRLSS